MLRDGVLSGTLSTYVICIDQLIYADGQVVVWYIEYLIILISLYYAEGWCIYLVY